MEARVSTLETEVDHLGVSHASTSKTVSAVEPWVGPEGQLRVRLERLEQAFLALINDPHNPVSSAQLAQAILTAIPTPQA